MGESNDVGDGDGLRPGTLDDGFNLVAKDLDRAFCLGLTTNQAVIMNSVREQSWTASLLARRKGDPRPNPVPVRVNLTHLAADCGLNRSRLSVALKALITASMLASTEAGYLINKDYSKWLDDEGKEPRFTPVQLRFIRAAKTPKKGIRISDIDTQLPLQSATVEAGMNGDIDTQLPLQSATVNDQLPLQSATASVHPPLRSATATVAKRNSAPLEERTAEDFLDLNSIPPPTPSRGGAVRVSDLPAPESEPTPAPEPAPRQSRTRPVAELGTAPALVEGPGRDSPEAIALEAWAGHLGTDRDMESYAFWARQACDFAPAPWIRVLLERRVKTRTDRVGLAYLNKILGNWLKSGTCEYLDGGPSGLPASGPIQPVTYHTAPANSRHRRNPKES